MKRIPLVKKQIINRGISLSSCLGKFFNNLIHYVMENGENQHTFIRRSELAFPSEKHSVVK